MSSLLAARHLSVRYGSAIAVRELDLDVGPREVVALLGPNGAGKTTTLRCLSGDLRPAAGEVLWEGRPTRAPLYKRCRNGLGFVTEGRAVLRQLTGIENLKVLGADPERVLALFPELSEHLRRPVGLLSGGQQQMLALGVALARRPKVLLVDELSMGLAPLVVDRLLRAIRDAADNGVGVLLVEQAVRQALTISDHVHVLQRGSVVLSGKGGDMADRITEIEASYLSSLGPA